MGKYIYSRYLSATKYTSTLELFKSILFGARVCVLIPAILVRCAFDSRHSRTKHTFMCQYIAIHMYNRVFSCTFSLYCRQIMLSTFIMSFAFRYFSFQFFFCLFLSLCVYMCTYIVHLFLDCFEHVLFKMVQMLCVLSLKQFIPNIRKEICQRKLFGLSIYGLYYSCNDTCSTLYNIQDNRMR